MVSGHRLTEDTARRTVFRTSKIIGRSSNGSNKTRDKIQKRIWKIKTKNYVVEDDVFKSGGFFVQVRNGDQQKYQS